MGVLLPVLETYRRGIGEWRVNFTTMFEDYWAGALLLVAAWAASRRGRGGSLLLLAVWGGVAGMIFIATVAQVEITLRGAAESRNTQVLIAKILLFPFSVSGLVSAFRSASHFANDDER
jgi:hypothetical protein